HHFVDLFGPLRAVVHDHWRTGSLDALRKSAFGVTQSSFTSMHLRLFVKKHALRSCRSPSVTGRAVERSRTSFCTRGFNCGVGFLRFLEGRACRARLLAGRGISYTVV